MDERYARIFQIDSETGLMSVPDGAGAELDYEKNQYFKIKITVKDRCQFSDDCSFGKLAKCCGNTCRYW
jgi:hypothetical protein